MIGRQIVVDPRVKGVDHRLQRAADQTARGLRAATWPRCAAWASAVVESGRLLKVVPEADAKLQAGTRARWARWARGDQVLTQMFRLRHENPTTWWPCCAR
jgi:general secretion pathway protein D